MMVENLKVFLPTCAKTRHIVGVSKKLWLLHTPFVPEFVDLGVNDVKVWTQDVRRALIRANPGTFLIFGLDDYLVNAFDEEVYRLMLEYVKTHGISRYSLLSGFDRKPDAHVVERCKLFDIIEMEQTATYRMGCQISVWNTAYFLHCLVEPRSPWKFEIEGTAAAQNDGARIIGTGRRAAFQYSPRSALSRKWKGIKLDGLSDSNRAAIASELAACGGTYNGAGTTVGS